MSQMDVPAVRVRVDERSGKSAVTVGGGLAAVTIPVRRMAGEQHVGLLVQQSTAVGEGVLSFPRGATRDLSALQASLRLEELTGLEDRRPELLGFIHPDPEVLDTTVGVFRSFHPERCPSLKQETATQLTWVPVSGVGALIVAGEIRCGISLAAWSMFASIAGVAAPRLASVNLVA